MFISAARRKLPTLSSLILARTFWLLLLEVLPTWRGKPLKFCGEKISVHSLQTCTGDCKVLSDLKDSLLMQNFLLHFSFGVVVWEMLLAQAPWAGLNPLKIINHVGYGDARLRVPDESTAVGRLLLQCFSDASERPTFVQLLQEFDPSYIAPGSALPDEFVCPITVSTTSDGKTLSIVLIILFVQLGLMKDPVLCADGITYERAAITAWLENHNTSPKTNLKLPNKRLTPNIALRAVINRFTAAK